MRVGPAAPPPATGRRCQSQAEQDEAVSCAPFRQDGFISSNSKGRSSPCPSLIGEILLSCHNRGRSTSHTPDRHRVGGSFFISGPAEEAYRDNTQEVNHDRRSRPEGVVPLVCLRHTSGGKGKEWKQGREVVTRQRCQV